MYYEAEEGQILDGNYRVHEWLGEGANANVWAATDIRDGTSVALKISTTDQWAIIQCQTEANILKKLDSPYIIKIFDSFRMR